MRTVKEKVDLLYAVSARVNEIAVVADRKGCGETGRLMLDLMDFLAVKIGLPPDYRERADEDRLLNENLQELLNRYPEE
jgi:hypothetical protein